MHNIFIPIGADTSKGKVQNLASAINSRTLIAIHNTMDGKKALGIDGMSKEEYSIGLNKRIYDLISRMKREAYKPKPSRRVYIDKPGSNKKRPLVISSYEDKLVERAVANILEIVYEPKFCENSYGFRSDRNCHQAIREVIEAVQYRKINYVVEADIKSFFDKLNHDRLIKFLEHDIVADKKYIGIIKRFLKAGIMENGKLIAKEEGSPQGNGASPILANIYLHYVLDLWFEKSVKKRYKGQAHLIRYADDFVCCFQYKHEAEQFYTELIERFAKFDLELSHEKTKILEFGRFAEENRKNRGEGKPETFDFLGFTLYCSRDGKKGFFRVKVKSCRKKVISKLKKVNEWIKSHRHFSVKDIIDRLNLSLVGYYHYYGVTDNTKSLEIFRMMIIKMVYKWLN